MSIRRFRVAFFFGSGAAVAFVAAHLATGCGSDDSPSIADSDSGAETAPTPTSTGTTPPPQPDAGKEGGADAMADASDGGLADGQVLDGGTAVDAAPGGNTTGIPCGSVASCPTNGAVCCTYPVQDGGVVVAYSYECVGGATCPAGNDGGQTASKIQCTSSANCAGGTVCCVSPIPDNQGLQSVQSSCKAACGNNAAQLCNPAAADAGCPAADPCSSTNITTWNLPGSWGTCGGVHAP